MKLEDRLTSAYRRPDDLVWPDPAAGYARFLRRRAARARLVRVSTAAAAAAILAIAVLLAGSVERRERRPAAPVTGGPATATTLSANNQAWTDLHQDTRQVTVATGMHRGFHWRLDAFKARWRNPRPPRSGWVVMCSFGAARRLGDLGGGPCAWQDRSPRPLAQTIAISGGTVQGDDRVVGAVPTSAVRVRIELRDRPPLLVRVVGGAPDLPVRFFVAFLPHGSEVVQVAALDARGHQVAWGAGHPPPTQWVTAGAVPKVLASVEVAGVRIDLRTQADQRQRCRSLYGAPLLWSMDRCVTAASSYDTVAICPGDASIGLLHGMVPSRVRVVRLALHGGRTVDVPVRDGGSDRGFFVTTYGPAAKPERIRLLGQGDRLLGQPALPRLCG
jgi:hypothetical protein